MLEKNLTPKHKYKLRDKLAEKLFHFASNGTTAPVETAKYV